MNKQAKDKHFLRVGNYTGQEELLSPKSENGFSLKNAFDIYMDDNKIQEEVDSSQLLNRLLEKYDIDSILQE